MLGKLLSTFLRGDARSKRAKKNVSVAFVCRGISLLIGFLVVPLTLNYAGKAEYGIWLTIYSIISWFTFFDVGLGNGLRNKLAEALACGDVVLARRYVSSAYGFIALVSMALFAIFFSVSLFLPWNKILNTDLVSNNELMWTVIAVFFFFCIELVLKLLGSMLQAIQRHAINNIISLVAQVYGLIAIYALTRLTDGSLFKLCLVFGSKTAIILIISSIVLFWGSLKYLRPKFSFFSVQHAKPLFKLGAWFFVAQILYLIVHQSSSILVIQFFGPEEVTVYNLAKKYITLSSMMFIMVLSPYLTAFTEAYVKEEYDWIKRTMKNIRKIWALSSLVVVIMVLVHKFMFKIWIGDSISIPSILIVVLAISTILGSLSSQYTLFLNGIGKVRMQVIIGAIQAVVFIPLSYLFYSLGAGLASIALVNVVNSLLFVWVFRYQYRLLMNKTAQGVWNK